MTEYLLTIYNPEGPLPAPEFLEKVMRGVAELIQEMKGAGVWVFNGGLQPPSAAKVLQHRRGEVLLTEGPHLDGEEYVGGFVIIRVSDPEAALAWGRRLALVIPLPIEVRPFVDDAG